MSIPVLNACGAFQPFKSPKLDKTAALGLRRQSISLNISDHIHHVTLSKKDENGQLERPSLAKGNCEL